MEKILEAFQSLQNAKQHLCCCLNLGDHLIVTLRQSCDFQRARSGCWRQWWGTSWDPGFLWDTELSNPAVGLSHERGFLR